MTGSELSAAFADVLRRYGLPALADDEWTVQQFADDQGITYSQADRIVQRAVDANAVTYAGQRRLTGGHVAKAYRYVSSPCP